MLWYLILKNIERVGVELKSSTIKGESNFRIVIQKFKRIKFK